MGGFGIARRRIADAGRRQQASYKTITLRSIVALEVFAVVAFGIGMATRPSGLTLDLFGRVALVAVLMAVIGAVLGVGSLGRECADRRGLSAAEAN